MSVAAEDDVAASEAQEAAPTAQPPSGLSPFLFPPRGPGRPKLRQILSEPSLRNEFLGVARSSMLMAGQLRDQPQNESLSEIMDQLTTSFAAGRAQHRRQTELEQALQRAKFQQQPPRTPDKAAWAYDKPKNVFDANIGKLDRSGKASNFSTSMELKAAEDGWKDPRTNDRGRERDEFGTKSRDRMGPTELKFANRLDETLTASRALEREDLQRRTIRGTKSWSTQKL